MFLDLVHSFLFLFIISLLYSGGRIYRFFRPMTPFYPLFFSLGTSFFRTVWNIRVRTPICRPRTNAIYVCNHSSSFDVFFLMFIWAWSGRDFCILSNQYVAKYPLLGYFLTYKNQHILIDKTSRENKTQALERMKKALEEGKDLYIFPEGRRNPDGKKLLPFYPGAFTMGREYPVYPVVFLGLDRVAPLKGIFGKSWDRPLEMHILDPVVSDVSYMNQVQDQMQEVLDQRWDLPVKKRRWSEPCMISLLGLLGLSIYYQDVLLFCKIFISWSFYRTYENKHKFLHTIVNTLYVIRCLSGVDTIWGYLPLYGYVVATVLKQWTLRNLIDVGLYFL